MNEQAYWNEMYAAACEQRRPFIQLRPSISVDGDRWCVLYGENLQCGVAGFGDTPELAAWDFDKQWCARIPHTSEPKKCPGFVAPMTDAEIGGAMPICINCGRGMTAHVTSAQEPTK